VYRVFQWLLMPFLIWLPVDLYLRVNDKLDLQLSIWFDWGLWALVSLELVCMLRLVQDRARFLRQNWVSPVIALTALPLLSLHRIHELLYLLRALAALVLLSHLMRLVLQMLKRKRLAPLFLVMLLIAAVGGLLVFAVEPETFKNPGNGVWFAIETMSTVGYGEFVPASLPGRLIAAFLMAAGVALLALLAGRMAAYFEEQSDDDARASIKQILHKLEAINARLEKMEQRSTAQAKNADDSPARLD